MRIIKTTLCGLGLFAASITASVASDNTASAPIAPATPSTPAVPACPCDFNAQALSQKIATMQNGTKSCMTVNSRPIDHTAATNEHIASSITLTVINEFDPATTQTSANTNSIDSFKKEMSENMISWSVGYTNAPNPAASGGMRTGKYCTTNVMDPESAKQLNNQNEYILCLREILTAAKSIHLECIPVTNFPEIPAPATQPSLPGNIQPENTTTSQQPAQPYRARAYFSEAIQATLPYRVAVNDCVQMIGTAKGCNAGSNTIPAAITQNVGIIKELSVMDGVIIVTPLANPELGIQETDTYILTPNVQPDKSVTWESSGGAVKNGFAD